MKLLQRLQTTLGLGEQFDDLDYIDAEQGELYPELYGAGEGYRNQSMPVNKVSRLTGLPTEVVLMKPRSFEEIPQAVMALRERKSVILNLSLLDINQAQRCADYVAGGAFAIDGHQERLGNDVFLFTPSSVQISNYSTPNPTGSQQSALFHPPVSPNPSWSLSPPWQDG
jgi:cell division inhibitor SepF